MSKPRLLDLFCGAGGCSVGYYRAGFDVTGVDIVPQPRYPFEFHQADAMTFPLDGYDVIHASPPCQGYSVTFSLHSHKHPMLLDVVRQKLQASGKMWVIENVPGAPIQSGIMLCGSMFDLWRLRRHRYFESSHMLFAPGPCKHKIGETVIMVFGHGDAQNYTLENGQKAMGIDWMNRKGLSQAIPPAYTEWVGNQLVRQLCYVPLTGKKIRTHWLGGRVDAPVKEP